MDIFAPADRAAARIARAMSGEYQRLAGVLDYDELNILDARKRVRAMFTRMDGEARTELRRTARDAYSAAAAEAEFYEMLDDLDFIEEMLRGYDPLTGYVYSHEWLRKRDRLFEFLVAARDGGNQAIRRGLKRSMDVTFRQAKQEADNVVIRARLKAFADAGVEYVEWVAQKDDRTCIECMDRDGEIFPIDEVPPLPAHWNCRCWVRAVRGGREKWT